ncbi:18900_t:CDS:1, partial [Dentiscutata erythropus]
MKRNNNEPDKISYTSLMDYFADNHQIRNAQKTFDYMCKQGIPHDIISYTVLAKAYALLGNIKGCWYVFIEMIKAGYEPDSVSTLIMLNAYNRKKDIKGAIKYLKEDYSGIEKLNTWHYNIILNMLARDKQRANGAFLLFMKMLYSQNQPSNFSDSSDSSNSSSVQKTNTINLSIESDKSDGNDDNIANNIDPSPSSSLFTHRELNIPLPDIDS